MHVADAVVTVDEIKDDMKPENITASGPDDISVDHIVHALYRLVTILCLCLNAFLTHGILPNSLMRVNIVQIIKN